MRLRLEAEQLVWRAGEPVSIRIVALNDSYETAVVDRRLLVGPNVAPELESGIPYPIAVEPAFEEQALNEVVLNPGCLYGRERTYDNLLPGRVVVYGYLLSEPSGRLLPHAPAEEGVLAESAEPLVLTVES